MTNLAELEKTILETAKRQGAKIESLEELERLLVKTDVDDQLLKLVRSLIAKKQAQARP